MIDFEIQENLIVFRNSLIAIYSLEPVDIFLLNSEQSILFENNLRKFLNNLKQEEIQIIMRSRRTQITDLKKHFRSLKLQKTITNFQDELLNDYISELSDLIDRNLIPYKEYFIVLKTACNNKIESRIENIKKLEVFIRQVSSNLAQANIQIKQITNEKKDLEKLIQSFLRI